ncbi:MAG TPA: valine--tRNA ligase [Actinomycetota bacterium]|nr:valine--tRNA ligase [Actinomycetota bacterium]
MSEELAKAYQPHDIEDRWYRQWEESGVFGASPDPDRPPFTIVLPPPNVTGVLHMGHALNHTLQDFFVRRARMRGFETLWLPGLDHAGIATQNVVERLLKQEGTDRHELGRERFVERVWQWKEQYGDRMVSQMRRLGESCDWSRERFTMDEGLSRAVRTIFVRWFDDGLIYRGLRIINWCPRDTTALSDIEVDHEDVAGELVTFRYKLADGSESIPVATTRVETMLGDTGIFVHPDDDRYKDVVGVKVKHPFFPERDMPIVADEGVDPEFGTGAVKGTPAHDPLDFEMGERHGLEKINILDETARINENGGEFAGLDRYEARQAVLHRLQELGLVEKIERPYVHAVGHCYRCGTEIEPWLSEQWFVSMEPLAKPAIEVVEDGRVSITPARFRKQYLDWMYNLRDWCISRQLWWGHRLPVWYCDDCGETFAAMEDPTECPKCSSGSLRQDPDVLDTWFSSQLWPFSTLGWPDETKDLDFFYPTTVMITAYEILYLWVARMIMSGIYAMGEVPFRDVFIHGIVRDFEGKKMSKSLGNVIDPIDMVEKYGADALRFSLMFQATPGNDMNASEERIQGARNFANKLWNAARFVLMAIDEERPEIPGDGSLALEDRWILSRLDETIGQIDEAVERYNVAGAMKDLHAFIWTEYCDWYIELAKLRLDGADGPVAKGVLVHVLDRILRALHPAMPFITEELWSRLHPGADSIMVAALPVAEDRRDSEAEAVMARFRELVASLRRLKVEHEIPQGQRIPVAIAAHSYRDEIEELSGPLSALAKLGTVTFTDSVGGTGGARVITGAGIEASVDLGEVVDLDVERARLAKRIEETNTEAQRAEKKLANQDFVTKAPEDVVEKERTKLAEARDALEKLEAQLRALGS